MSARSFAFAMTLAVTGAVLSGCVDQRGVDGRSDLVVTDQAGGGTETRAERNARGEYRRGFSGQRADERAEFCRLNPADLDCVGRRF